MQAAVAKWRSNIVENDANQPEADAGEDKGDSGESNQNPD